MNLLKNQSFLKRGTAHIGRTTDNTGLTAGANAAFNLFETSIFNDSSGVSITSASQIKLVAGKKYKLRASVSLLFSGAANMTYGFYNVTAGAYITGTYGHRTSSTDATADGKVMDALAYFTPTVDTTIEVRIVAISTGTVSTLFAGSHAEVEELEERISQVYNTYNNAYIAGIPEADKTANGVKVRLNSYTSLAAFKAVAFSISSSGKFVAASNTSYDTVPAIGLTLETALNGYDCDLLLQGFVRNDAWNWTIGKYIYLDTAGGLTQTAPTTVGVLLQILGVAVTADVMYFNPNVLVMEL